MPKQTTTREILGLAIPAMGSLLVEPALLLTDSAIVGHWSTDALAGLGLAQNVLLTIVGLCIFLAYSTTAATSRALGAGRKDQAIKSGIDAIWLGIFLGIIAAILTIALAKPVIGLFGASEAVNIEAQRYLTVSALGLPAMLAVQAATGLIRGLQDTRTPLFASIAGAVINVPLSLLMVHGLRWGVIGAAVGTVIAQYLMAMILVWVVAKEAVGAGVSLRPDLHGVLSAWKDGIPLLLRTLSLRAALLLLSGVAAGLGTAQLAAHQIVWNIRNFLSSGLDAIAIAAQALTGKYLGAGDVKQAQSATNQMMRWGVIGGTVIAITVLGAAVFLPTLFSPDPAVQSGIRAALIVVVIGQPLAGVVYVLDGVLIGAGDAKYLAGAGVFNLVCLLPALWVIVNFGPGGDAGLVWLWISWAGWYMGWRAVTLLVRKRSGKWLRVGTEPAD